jgi:hypothetical protein
MPHSYRIMKTLEAWKESLKNDGRVIAQFGRASLVHKPDGRFEVMGGTVSDHTDAKQWISLFLHEAAVTYSK